VFLCVEPLVGKRQVSVTQRRTLLDFADQLSVSRRMSDDLYPQAEKIVLVLDNLNTHIPAALYERFAPAEARRLASRFEWHYTPEHGSWLNPSADGRSVSFPCSPASVWHAAWRPSKQ
jgi:hypothetical protein